jgi:hypothetical protein
VDDFYDEMWERMEEAKDRAVLARYRTTCPRMAEKDLMGEWLELVKQRGREGARQQMTVFLDLHEQLIAQGLVGFLDVDGMTLDNAGEDVIHK